MSGALAISEHDARRTTPASGRETRGGTEYYMYMTSYAYRKSYNVPATRIRIQSCLCSITRLQTT